MIQLAHLAAGALAGEHRSSPATALLAGLASHALLDVAPHGEVNDSGFEAASAVAGVVVLTLRHGITSPVTWGAIGGVLPDLEHVVPRTLRPRRPVFPTHRFTWLHGWETKPFTVPAWMQALAGGIVIGGLVVAARAARPTPAHVRGA